MTEVQKVISGRRISIPQSLAKELNIKVGDIMIVEPHISGGILITPAEVIPRKKK